MDARTAAGARKLLQVVLSSNKCYLLQLWAAVGSTKSFFEHASIGLPQPTHQPSGFTLAMRIMPNSPAQSHIFAIG